MDLKEAIYTRRAAREFTAEPVDDETLRQLIDAAVQAPSAVNQQPWSFCVIRDKALLARISSEAKAHMLRTSPAALSHHFQEIMSDPKFDIFYRAPALVVISSVAESPWTVENCALEHFPKRLNRGIPLRERIGFKVRAGMEASMDGETVFGRSACARRWSGTGWRYLSGDCGATWSEYQLCRALP